MYKNSLKKNSFKKWSTLSDNFYFTTTD